MRRLARIKNIFWYFLAISHGKVVVPFLEIALNLPGTHGKLDFKEEQYRFSEYRDTLVQTERQNQLHLYKDCLRLYEENIN